MTVTAMPNNDTKEEKKGGRRNLIVIAVLLLVILAGGAYMVLKPKGGSAHSKPAPPAKGAVLALSNLQINLADGHYLSLGLALQETKKASADLDGSQAEDAAINEFTGLSLQQVDTAAQREQLKAELLKTLEKDYPDEVMDVYYTAFVTQ